MEAIFWAALSAAPAAALPAPDADPAAPPRRDLTLLNATTVNTSGRSVIVGLELPKSTFREMVEKELKK